MHSRCVLIHCLSYKEDITLFNAFSILNRCSVAGFGIGVIFGVFTASVDPMSTYSTATDAPPSTREYLREMKSRSMSYGKNFAVVGMMFAGIECTVESVSVK